MEYVQKLNTLVKKATILLYDDQRIYTEIESRNPRNLKIGNLFMPYDSPDAKFAKMLVRVVNQEIDNLLSLMDASDSEVDCLYLEEMRNSSELKSYETNYVGKNLIEKYKYLVEKEILPILFEIEYLRISIDRDTFNKHISPLKCLKIKTSDRIF